jgi:hypothetical protein
METSNCRSPKPIFLCSQQQALSSSHSSRPPRGAPRGMAPRMHRFYPTNPASLPRNIHRSSVRPTATGHSPPASAAGIGWILGSSPVDSGMMGGSPRSGKIGGHSPSSGSLPLPHFQHPSYELLDRNGFQQMKYDRWKQRCLEERSLTGTPSYPPSPHPS